MPQKTIMFPADLLGYIDEQAKKEKRSFSSMTEILLEKGKEQYEEERAVLEAIQQGKTQINPEYVKRS